jgi:hypothetical protein
MVALPGVARHLITFTTYFLAYDVQIAEVADKIFALVNAHAVRLAR